MIKEALLKKLEGDIAVAEADLRTFLAQPIGVAEHIDYVVLGMSVNLLQQQQYHPQVFL